MVEKVISQVGLMLVAFLLCVNSWANDDAGSVIRIGKMIPSGGSNYYRWGLHLRGSANAKGLPIPASCSDSVRYLKLLVPKEIFEITLNAYVETVQELGKNNRWQDEDFAVFHANWSDLVENVYPGEGGFYWDARDLILKEWERKGSMDSGVICDPMNIAASQGLPNRYDALMISIARGK